MFPPSHHGFSTQSNECSNAVKGSADSETRCDVAYGRIVSNDTPWGEYMTDRVFSRSLYGDGTMVEGDNIVIGDRGDAGGLIGRSR
jgi:hypothetical protein